MASTSEPDVPASTGAGASNGQAAGETLAQDSSQRSAALADGVAGALVADGASAEGAQDMPSGQPAAETLNRPVVAAATAVAADEATMSTAAPSGHETVPSQPTEPDGSEEAVVLPLSLTRSLGAHLQQAPQTAVIGRAGSGEQARGFSSGPGLAGLERSESYTSFHQRVADAIATTSIWRFPTTPGKMPLYVQRNFRLKAMSLICVQLLVVLAVMALVSSIDLRTVWRTDLSLILLSLIVVMVLALTILTAFRTIYPVNYILLVFVTLLAGLVWGVGGSVLPAMMHFQIVGIMFVTMVIATFVAFCLSHMSSHQPLRLVWTSILSGWLASSALDLFIMSTITDSELHTFIAVAITGFLFAIFLFEVGKLLVTCNPDTFMNVVVAMDSALLVIVSVPIFWAIGLSVFVSCCLRDEIEDDEANAQATIRAQEEGAPQPGPVQEV